MISGFLIYHTSVPKYPFVRFLTFLDTLLNKMGNNCEFHKKEIEMMVLSSLCKQKSAYALFCSERCLKCVASDLTFIK